MHPICKIGCILENLAKKSTKFAPNWVLFAEKWYRDGSQNHAFRGIEMVEILNSTLSIPVRIFLRTPPPGLEMKWRMDSINLRLGKKKLNIFNRVL